MAAPPAAQGPPSSPGGEVLRARIRECAEEWQRLRSDYDAEVRRCASLRDSLQARQAQLASRPAGTPAQEPRALAPRACAAAEEGEGESRARMALEDDLCRWARALSDHDARATALRASLEEATTLRAGVELRERAVACLEGDLERAIECLVSLVGAEAAEALLPGGSDGAAVLSPHAAAGLRSAIARASEEEEEEKLPRMLAPRGSSNSTSLQQLAQMQPQPPQRPARVTPPSPTDVLGRQHPDPSDAVADGLVPAVVHTATDRKGSRRALAHAKNDGGPMVHQSRRGLSMPAMPGEEGEEEREEEEEEEDDDEEDPGASIIETAIGWVGGIANIFPDAGDIIADGIQRMMTDGTTERGDTDDAESWAPAPSEPEQVLTPRGTRIIAGGDLLPSGTSAASSARRMPAALWETDRSLLAAGLQGRDSWQSGPRPAHWEGERGRPDWREGPGGGAPPVPEDPDPEEEWACPTPARSPSPAGARQDRAAGWPPSAAFEEEARLVREGLAREVRQLAALLLEEEPGRGPVGAEARGAGRLLRELLGAAPPEGGSEEDRAPHAVAARGGGAAEIPPGWGAWHVAAATGRTDALERLKDDLFESGGHHRTALGGATLATQVTPLGVALILGQAGAARSLLAGMAPVDSVDWRGNGPLHWAVAGGTAEAMVPLLLEARADPGAQNRSGQHIDVFPYVTGHVSRLQGLLVPPPGAGRPAASPAPPGVVGSPARADPSPAATAAAVEATAVVLAGSTDDAEAAALAGRLDGDAAGFAGNGAARAAARLDAEEAERGVLSEWVLRATCCGLQAPGGEAPAACRQRRCARQALVLTARRLLLFDPRPAGWVLAQDAPLLGIVELAVPSQSPKLLLLRQHGLPDAVLSVPAAARARLVGKFRSALGSLDLGGLRLQQEASPVVALLDEHHQRVGALASVGAGGFVLLSYAPILLDMSGEEVRFFGVLDLCEDGGSPPPSSAWQRHLVALKAESAGIGLRLLWCPQAHCGATPGALRSAFVREAHAVDADADLPEETRRAGDDEPACFSVRGVSDGQLLSVMLRASAVQMRGDWMAVLSGGLLPLKMHLDRVRSR